MTTKPPDYRYLTVTQKQRRFQDAMREPPQVCPCCETSTTPADMPRHLEACPGPREPHPHAKWIWQDEAMQLGVPWATLHRWVRQGRVQTRISVRDRQGRGRPAVRQYLLRDITKLVALRHRIMPTDGQKR